MDLLLMACEKRKAEKVEVNAVDQSIDEGDKRRHREILQESLEKRREEGREAGQVRIILF